MEGKHRVIVLGAGAAGLVAADALLRFGFSVMILEARNRLGGRIHTIQTEDRSPPIELGAEFIHGSKNNTWSYIRGARLDTHQVPDRHWLVEQDHIVEDLAFWEDLAAVTDKIDVSRPDEDFETFLDHADGLSERARWLSREYVEGFHAAPTHEMSVHALAKAEAAAVQGDGTKQFRVAAGYARLMEILEQRIDRAGGGILFQHPVQEVRWTEGSGVEVLALNHGAEIVFHADAAVITVPLGVLKTGSLKFVPWVSFD